MPGGSKKGGGLEVKDGYTPYKMRGHTLPGPNQRTPLEYNSYTQAEEEVNNPNNPNSPNNLDVIKDPNNPNVINDPNNQNSPNNQNNPSTNTYVDNNAEEKTGVNDMGLAPTEDDTVKKNVDVEVTVNGNKV